MIMNLSAIALLSMTLVCTPVTAVRTAEPVIESSENMYATVLVQNEFHQAPVLAEEAAAGTVTEEDDTGLDIRYLLFLQEFRNNINDALTPFI